MYVNQFKTTKNILGEAIKIACHLINRCPSSSLDNKVLEQVWLGHVPDYSHLRTFWCVTYAHQTDSKLESRYLKCVFLGYGERIKGYRLCIKENRAIK